jgi:uncharacterized protein
MTTTHRHLRLDVADLLAHPGSRRAVTLSAELPELETTAAAIVGPVDADLVLDRISDGIVVRGTLRARWRGVCSICLRDLERPVEVGVDELFETHPIEGETYPIAGHEIDLEQLVRDSVVLELPLVPHCEEPCSPSEELDLGADIPDPRWSPLADLKLDA